jgi:hypothetical protein
MHISERLGTMTDVELKNLSSNAERLGHSGSSAQQEQAKSLLPLVSAEILARKGAKLAEAKTVAKPAARSRKKAVVTADADE